MTHWKGNDVLYIGDHIYGDLAVNYLLLMNTILFRFILGFIS